MWANRVVEIGSTTDNESRAMDGHKGPDSEHFKKNISSQQSEVRWEYRWMGCVCE
jgi:hypothetical protein